MFCYETVGWLTTLFVRNETKKTEIQMKALLTVVALVLSISSFAHADQISANADENVNLDSLESVQQVPRAGAMTAKVVTSYAGTAFALSKQQIVIYNMEAPCEGDDCTVYKIFDLGLYSGSPTALYSRKIDESTYSIAIIGKKVDVGDGSADAKYPKVKTLITVKFSKTDVANVISVKESVLK